MMTPLNLPAIEAKIITSGGKKRIFDPVRRKYVVLTPEEWVRQHFIVYLHLHLQYPKALIRVESGLQVNSLNKRSDILVHDREGKPWMLVECKAPEVKLDRKAFNQAAIYNMTIGARYVAVTNGLVHFCCETFGHGVAPEFLKEFPEFIRRPPQAD